MTTKILVVDDSAVIRHVVSKGLADKGYDVISAINGYEGLEILRDVEVDAVISDYCMPVMNGYVFLEAVRKDFPDLPFIFFTSEIDRYISTSLQDQLCCLVAKTGSIDSLGEVLEQVAARSGTVGIVSDDTVSL